MAVLAGCGGGGGVAAGSDAGVDVAADDAEVDAGAACTLAADCPQDGCRLAACLDGTCAYVDRADGTVCDDGLACTTGDRCVAGACQPTGSTCEQPCATDADCPPAVPGDLCQGRQRCHDGACDPTLPVTSAVMCDGTPCEPATCDPATGRCVWADAPAGTPCDDADPCTVTSCVQGACVETGDSPCECRTDDDCRVLDVPCQDRHACLVDVFPSVCVVVPGSATVCTDDLPDDCLGRACDPLTDACADVPLADGTACDDGAPCTVTACLSGACAVAGPGPCECEADADCPDDGDACNGVPVCDLSVFPYACSVDPETVPDPCPTDADTPCLHAVCAPETRACHAVPRNSGDPCLPDDPCQVDGVCDLGACVGVPRACDDGNPCTTDACHPLTGACEATNVADLSECPPPHPCDAQAQCLEGTCLALAPKSCDDHNACTLEGCNGATGVCDVQRLTGPACDDGVRCTTDDACDDGACTGTPRTCDDGNACTTDACDEATGLCTFVGRTGEPCDDGDACTLGDLCDADGDCVPGAAPPCLGTGVCWHYACIPASGTGQCEIVPDPAQEGLPCYSFGKCGIGAVCEQGQCRETLFTGGCCDVDGDCDDGEACTVDTCTSRRCTYQPFYCDDADQGCDAGTCQEGACTTLTLGSRRVLFERVANQPGWAQAVHEAVQGSFEIVDGAARLSGLMPAGWLTLPPVRVPRGNSTLRLHLAGPLPVPDDVPFAVVDTLTSQHPPARVVVFDGQPGYDVLVDLSVTYNWTRRLRLEIDRTDVALESVQLVHHGGQGCPDPLGTEATTTTLDATGTALQVTACASAAGERLVVWTEAGQTASRLGWRLWDGQGWGAENTAGGEFDVQPEFSLSCAAVGEGWFVAFGAIYSDGFKTAHLLRLDATGVAKSNSYVTLASGDHTEWPALAVMPNGDLLVAFASDLIDGDSTGIALARYKADGTAVGTENVLVNEFASGTQRRPTLAVGATTVLVAWESKLGTNKTQLSRRTFDLGLNPASLEQTFTNSNTVEYLHPFAAALASPSEHFLVAYEAVGKTSPADAGTGVYHTTFSVDGSVLIDEQPVAYAKANDQLSPRVGVVSENALVSWRSDASDQYSFDLVEARIDSVGHQGNALVLKGGVQALGPALPDEPGAALYPYIKDGKVGLARLGVLCDVGKLDCSTTPPGLCVDADAYLPAVSACLGGGCTPLCP
jgi:hypothetical protein